MLAGVQRQQPSDDRSSCAASADFQGTRSAVSFIRDKDDKRLFAENRARLWPSGEASSVRQLLDPMQSVHVGIRFPFPERTQSLPVGQRLGLYPPTAILRFSVGRRRSSRRRLIECSQTLPLAHVTAEGISPSVPANE